MVKKLLLAISIAYTIALIVLSLINVHNIPSLGSSMDDKIYHLIAYLILAILWITFVKPMSNITLVMKVFFATVLLGILMEVLQLLLNPNRTFDTMDMLANTIGAIIGTLIAHRFTLLKLK